MAQKITRGAMVSRVAEQADRTEHIEMAEGREQRTGQSTSRWQRGRRQADRTEHIEMAERLEQADRTEPIERQ